MGSLRNQPFRARIRLPFIFGNKKILPCLVATFNYHIIYSFKWIFWCLISAHRVAYCDIVCQEKSALSGKFSTIKNFTMTIGSQISERRKLLKLNQRDVAKKVGINRSDLSRIENDKRVGMPESLLHKLAEVLKVPISYFYEEEPKESKLGIPPDFRNLPLYGSIKAGTPIDVEENFEGYVAIPGHYAVRVEGDCLEPKIQEGDILAIRKQTTAENGDIVIARYKGEVTTKQFFKRKDYIELKPFNPKYKPIRSKEVEIIGKVVRIIKRV